MGGHHYHKTTIDELGSSDSISLDVEIECSLQPAEARTHDCPGCPASIELENAIGLVFYGEEYTVDLSQRRDWGRDVDAIAYQILSYNWDGYEEEIREHLLGIDEAARDSAYESRMEIRRELEGEIA